LANGDLFKELDNNFSHENSNIDNQDKYNKEFNPQKTNINNNSNIIQTNTIKESKDNNQNLKIIQQPNLADEFLNSNENTNEHKYKVFFNFIF